MMMLIEYDRINDSGDDDDDEADHLYDVDVIEDDPRRHHFH